MDKAAEPIDVEDKQRGNIAPRTSTSYSDIPLESINDAWIQRGYIYLQLVNGRILALPADKHATTLYWEVKIRNRRRAFGL